MMKNAVNQVAKVTLAIGLLKQLLKEKRILSPRIILFGSYRENTNRRESDIDLAIVSTAFTGKDLFERSQMLAGIQWRLTRRLATPFDIVPLTPGEWKNRLMAS